MLVHGMVWELHNAGFPGFEEARRSLVLRDGGREIGYSCVNAMFGCCLARSGGGGFAGHSGITRAGGLESVRTKQSVIGCD